jgi:hypothetical protein
VERCLRPSNGREIIKSGQEPPAQAPQASWRFGSGPTNFQIHFLVALHEPSPNKINAGVEQRPEFERLPLELISLPIDGDRMRQVVDVTFSDVY